MINILEYLTEIKKNYKNIIIITLSFILMAGIYTTFFMNQNYEAITKIFIGKQNFENISGEYNNEEVTLYQRLINTYSEIIKTKKIINQSINDSEVNYSRNKNNKNPIKYGDVINNLKVTPISDTQIIGIDYKSNNAQEAYDLVYSLTKNLIDYSKELYPTVNIQVLEEVNIINEDILSKKVLICGIALILGLMSSIGLILLKVYLDNTFKDKNSLEDELGIAVLGVIPDFKI